MAFDREARPLAPTAASAARSASSVRTSAKYIDYKDAAKLRRFVSERSKILPPPDHRHLRHASASADRGHQARPADRSAALRHRLRQSFRTCEHSRPTDGSVFLRILVFFNEIERCRLYFPPGMVG